MEFVKLTDKDMRAFNGYQWVVGEKRTASGSGELDTKGWLHCYGAETQEQALLLAELLHPLHFSYQVRRCFSAKCGGQIRSDAWLKFGATEMTLGAELAPPFVTTVNRVAFGIICAMEVVNDRTFVAWGEGWLSGADRSLEAARAAELAASGWAARATATVTAWSAAWAWSAAERASAAWSAARAAAAVEEAEAALEAARAAARAAVGTGGSIPLGELAEQAMEIS